MGRQQMKQTGYGEKSGIKKGVIEEIRALAEKYNVSKVVLFGSRARGDFHKKSDIDLAVYGGDFVRFSLDADEETYTLLKYDFVDMGGYVQPELLESIRNEGVVLYEKNR